ncbi:MAG: amidase [Actinomycetota bacterium]|nr:amidase [Actinomycetota bacterium]
MFKKLDATAINRSLLNKEISIRDLIQGHKAALAVADDFNAITYHKGDDELEVDVEDIQRRIDGGDSSPLCGIPISVKDVVAVANMPLTGGSLLLADNVATRSAPVVQSTIDAGCFVVAKTNCPEFAFGITTSNLLYGTTLNPLDPLLSPGGSSGGEAVSVAIGVSLLGIGTDFGGSLRWPSQCLGLTSLRPTPQVLSLHGQIPGVGRSPFDGEAQYDVRSLQYKLQVPGFIARSIADLKSALGATALLGNDAIDGTGTAGIFGSSHLQSRLAIKVGEVEIGWSDGNAISVVDDEISTAIEELVKELEVSGFKTRYLGDALVGAREAFDDLRSFDDLMAIRRLADGRFDDLSPSLQKILSNPIRPRDGYELANANAEIIRNNALVGFEATPLFILPIAGAAAVGHDEIAIVNSQKIEGFNLMAHCRAVSLLGCPVVTVPIAKNKQGLPFGIQIVAAPFREYLALELARVVESIAGGWSYFSIER